MTQFPYNFLIKALIIGSICLPSHPWVIWDLYYEKQRVDWNGKLIICRETPAKKEAGSAKGTKAPKKKEEWFLSSLMPFLSSMRVRGGTLMYWDSQRKCGLRVVVPQTPTMTVLSRRANEWWINPGSPLANWDDPANLAHRQVPKEYIPHTPRLTK